MAKDFETLDDLNVRSYKYGLDYIKVGIGLGVNIIEEVVDRYRTEKVLEGD